jgi:DNA polymerase-4
MTANNINTALYWPRAIILVDMNAFFASVDQHDYPELKGRPIAVTNGTAGTCIITSSYEARSYGIKTGTRLREAFQLCPDLVVVPSHPQRYADVSRRIMESLICFTPDVEIFSIDEAFLDVTHCQQLFGSPEKIGQMIQQKIFEVSGLLCSIGISGDKTTAKYAAKIKKPNGFTVIPPWESEERLKHVPVSALCGIGGGITAFLAKYGVHTCGQMKQIPISILGKRFGNLGRRIWWMCQGKDPEKVHTIIQDPKSMGHGKVLPPNTKNKEVILTYFYHMCVKLGRRLRQHNFHAQHFYIGWKNYSLGWVGEKCSLPCPSADSKAFYELSKNLCEKLWHGEGIYQVQVTALDPQRPYCQKDLFTDYTKTNVRDKLYQTIDNINDKYGSYTMIPAPLLRRATNMNNVISPAWKPEGHRQTI